MTGDFYGGPAGTPPLLPLGTAYHDDVAVQIVGVLGVTSVSLSINVDGGPEHPRNPGTPFIHFP